jgi:hypothetical protein
MARGKGYYTTPVQYGYQYGIEILAKIFEHDPKSFFAVS